MTMPVASSKRNSRAEPQQVLDKPLGCGLGPEASHGQACESHQYSEQACNNAERQDAHRPDENEPANAAKQRLLRKMYSHQ
jgi:hypothetical protein